MKWMEDVRKVVFSGDVVSLNGINGKSESVGISELNHFNFFSDYVSGIKPVITEGKIVIAGSIVRVITDRCVKSLQIYDLNGVECGSSCESELSIAHLPKGVYLVKAQTDGTVINAKIIKSV